MNASSIEMSSVSRRELTEPEATSEVNPLLARARSVVANAALRITLMVDDPGGGRTMDGWVDAMGVVWHPKGDDSTSRPAIVATMPHLPSTIASMVGLGVRRTSRDEEVLAARADMWGTDVLRVLRIWTLTWQEGRHPATGFTIVDEGSDGHLWAVTEVVDDELRLRPVRSLDVWLRLCGLTRVGQPA